MNLKTLLVDDEINILKNLETVIPWESMGIEIVNLARNGQEALVSARQFKPDLILCDIRMPVMDGLSFIEQLRAEEMECEVIMLTGYKDFDYTRSAIQHGARDYVLKPINYEELKASVERVAVDIRLKHLKHRLEKKKWGKIVNLAYERVLLDLLRGYTTTESNFIFSEQEKNIKEMNFLLLVIDMDDYSQRSRYWSKEDRELWNFAVKNVLSTTFQEDELTYSVLQIREGEWSILIEQLSHSSAIDTEILNGWSNQLKSCVRTNLNLGISVGIYQQAVSITQLSGAYKQIQCELHLNASKKASDTRIIYDKTENKNEIDYSIWNLIEEIVTGLKQCNQESTNQALKNLNLTLQALSEQSLVRVEQILHFLIIHLLREMREMQFVTVEHEEAVWRNLEFCLGIKDLITIISQLIDSGMESAFKKKTSEMLMISAKDYIDRKMNSDIAVEEVAVHLGISNSYFSLLFKQHYGQTFVEYVTKQRMESAKSLLRMSDKSITQIGKQVGYAERRYFTKVFQKYTGVKPSAFRELRKGEECK